MKKLTILIALVLVVALAVPTYAASFSDVPSDHWAYAAVNEIVAAGIVEGYPDGTFKGDNNMTRYELAMVVSRMLDNIEEEREALADDMAAEIEASNESLSTGEVQDVTAIVKSLIEKNMPEQQEIPEGLTDEQADQVSNLIKALTYEYKSELEDLGADVEAIAGLEADVEDLQAEVAALKEEEANVSFSGVFAVDYEEIVIEGSGTPYEDPYTEDLDDDDEDDEYEETDPVTFEQRLEMNMAINNGPLSADVTLMGNVDVFNNDYTDNDKAFELDDIQATISNDDFVATIGEDQALTLKPYLYDGKVDEDDVDGDDAEDDPYFPVNGVIVKTMGETYVLSQNTDITSTPVAHDKIGTAFAGTQTLSVQGMDFNFAYGVEDGLSSGNSILGVDTTLEAGGFSVTPTVAFSDQELEETYFTLNATGDVGPVATEFNYENIEDFEAIAADVSNSKGYDVKGTMSVNIVDLAAYYENYEGSSPFMELKGEVTEENAQNIAGLAVYGNSTYANYSDVSDATAQEINVYADKYMGDLTLGGALEYADITSDFDTEYGDEDVYEETDKFDKILTADYVVSEALDVGAVLTFDKDNDLAHLYTADYEQGIITAGAEKYFNDELDAFILTAGVTPDAYELLSVNLAPYANFGYRTDDVDSYTKYALGVNADKSLSANATLTGMVEYADAEDGFEDIDNSGIKMTRELGVEYAITDDVSATADYTHLDFFADAAGESYDAKKATAGVSVSF